MINVVEIVMSIAFKLIQGKRVEFNHFQIDLKLRLKWNSPFMCYWYYIDPKSIYFNFK